MLNPLVVAVIDTIMDLTHMSPKMPLLLLTKVRAKKIQLTARTKGGRPEQRPLSSSMFGCSLPSILYTLDRDVLYIAMQ